MVTLDDFITTKGNVFISIFNPAPIVTGAQEDSCGGWLWIATPEQARRVRAQDYVAVMEGGTRQDPKRGNVPGAYYFSIIGPNWTPKGTEPVCTEIPAEVLA